MSKGKIVLIPFPFDDLSSSKVRPAVCLTDPVGIHHHIVLAFITSTILSNPLPSDVFLDRGDPDFPATGLRVSSTIKIHRLITVSAGIILRELGALTPNFQAEINEKLRDLFDLR